MHALRSLRHLQMMVFSVVFNIATAPLYAQRAGTFSLAVAGGVGVSSSDQHYEGSVNLTARLAVGFQLTSRLGLEVGGQVVGGAMFQGETICQLSETPDPCNSYAVRGVGGGIGVPIGRAPEAPRARLVAGAGSYFVPSDDRLGLWVLGVHMGGEVTVRRWGRGSLAIASRVLMLPNVNDERLWVVPVELTLRFW